MKLKSKSMWSLKRLVTLSLALIIALSMFSPLTAEAKTKSVKVKSLDYTSSVTTVKKKAQKVSVGTNNLTYSKVNGWGRGYIKFTAPKTKKFNFTVNSLKSSDGSYTNGHITAYMIKGSSNRQYLSSVKFKSNNFYQHIASRKSDYDMTSMKGTMKLNKGETVYIYCSFLASGKKGKITTKLVIK